MKKFVVGIDGNEANIEQRVGSNVYAYELLSALEAYLRENPLFSVKVFLAHDPVSDMPSERNGWEYVVVPHAPYWTQWKLPLALREHGDLSFFFSPGHYLPSLSPVPMAATFMDLAYELYPQYFRKKDLYQLKLLSRWSARQAKHLFAISDSTKEDVFRLYEREPSDITVVYPAAEAVKPLSLAKVEEILRKLEVSEPSILFVGTLQPRKNLIRLVHAFEQLKRDGWKGKLVLAGKIGWQAEGIMSSVLSSPFQSDILHLGYVSAEEKIGLIQSAECLVLPGLYEGFGIPPLEAIQLGTLPVVSNTSSLPEVVGEDGPMFDPLSEASMVKVLQEVLALSSAEKKQRLEKMKKHAEKFSWEKSAQVVANKITELLTI